MKYIVIGLGNFGSSLALKLMDLGHEVIGVDVDRAKAEALREKLSTTIILDAITVESLSVLPLDQVDIVAVAIGSDFAGSIQAVAALRQRGVSRIIARALNSLHVGILQTLGVERVVFPEKDAAESIAQSMAMGSFVSSYRVDTDHYVMQVIAHESLVGTTIAATRLKESYGLEVIAIKKVLMVKNLLGLTHSERVVADDATMDTVIGKGDTLVIYGPLKNYDRFVRGLVKV